MPPSTPLSPPTPLASPPPCKEHNNSPPPPRSVIACAEFHRLSNNLNPFDISRAYRIAMARFELKARWNVYEPGDFVFMPHQPGGSHYLQASDFRSIFNGSSKGRYETVEEALWSEQCMPGESPPTTPPPASAVVLAKGRKSKAIPIVDPKTRETLESSAGPSGSPSSPPSNPQSGAVRERPRRRSDAIVIVDPKTMEPVVAKIAGESESGYDVFKASDKASGGSTRATSLASNSDDVWKKIAIEALERNCFAKRMATEEREKCMARGSKILQSAEKVDVDEVLCHHKVFTCWDCYWYWSMLDEVMQTEKKDMEPEGWKKLQDHPSIGSVLHEGEGPKC